LTQQAASFVTLLGLPRLLLVFRLDSGDHGGGLGTLHFQRRLRLGGLALGHYSLLFGTHARIPFRRGLCLCGIRLRLSAASGGLGLYTGCIGLQLGLLGGAGVGLGCGQLLLLFPLLCDQPGIFGRLRRFASFLNCQGSIGFSIMALLRFPKQRFRFCERLGSILCGPRSARYPDGILRLIDFNQFLILARGDFRSVRFRSA
jgi:hypothetical protein